MNVDASFQTCMLDFIIIMQAEEKNKMINDVSKVPSVNYVVF